MSLPSVTTDRVTRCCECAPAYLLDRGLTIKVCARFGLYDKKARNQLVVRRNCLRFVCRHDLVGWADCANRSSVQPHDS